MPDITLCRGGTCPLRKKCHRYLARPYPIGQSYFAEVPYEETRSFTSQQEVVMGDRKCDYYWPEKREDTK